ncbi:hypothetical protein GKE82_11275 [Conexibacter sp. W3-3-2]|uniref:hypothetical protein n=1 Tax=Conexibacter sp. W3-3-2 TaxID=2675227 RepID=UPI0012B9731F|nr:hypothetical protein [Conexibacter sp. W3-3-2]MTD44855.1 hypothetical protein [Conexibacter sp. W3-3-2]
MLRATNIHRGKIVRESLMRADPSDVPWDRCPPLVDGEILVVRSGAYTGDSAIVTAEWEGAAPGYDLRVTPRRVDPRFLAYVMLSTPALDYFTECRSRAAQPHLNADQVAGLRIPEMERHAQAVVADLLDTETARIDALVSARMRQRQLIAERAAVAVDSLMARAPRITARRVFSRIDQGWSAVAEASSATEPGEVGVLRLDAVSAGAFFPSRNKRIDVAALRDDWRRFVVSDGDLLLARASGSRERVGESALVELAGEGPTLLFPDILYRLTPGERLSAAFAAAAMRSSDVRAQIREVARGTANSKIRSSDLRELQIPLPDPRRQAEIVAVVRRIDATSGATIAAIDKQIALLHERRQALITAAVTGRLQVPGAPLANAVA